MKPSDVEDLAQFLNELQKETDRGLPLVATSFIDEKLRKSLEAFFVNDTISKKLLDDVYAPLGSFSARIDACFALGLIEEFEYKEITLLRKVRNEFAHAKHGLSFNDQKIKGLCSSLTSNLPQDSGYDLNDPKFRFKNASIIIIHRLYYRPEWILREKRIAKSWVKAGDGEWVSVKDELPPENIPVIVIAEEK